jgi:hypothetical protein
MVEADPPDLLFDRFDPDALTGEGLAQVAFSKPAGAQVIHS